MSRNAPPNQRVTVLDPEGGKFRLAERVVYFAVDD
jgi:hypothetical protein